MSKRYIHTFQQVVSLPTAPFIEGSVVRFIREFVARRRQLRLRADRFGNLLVTYTPPARRRRLPKSPPILFAAHMDHPGLTAERMLDAGHVEARWRGWVQARYFPRERIKFRVGDRWVPAVIEKVVPFPPGKGPRRATTSARSFGADSPPKGVIARVGERVPRGSPGVWDITDAARRGGRLVARACDDLAGVAAIVCTFDEICREDIAVPCHALFTRAEEVGFGGALAAADGGTLPRRALVVAVECSKVIAGVELGGGPVLRVGDKASVFTPAATAYCQAVAERLAAEDKTFRFQRKLMDGGTCESTVYCHYGHDATGICLPLLNYHNMDTQRRKIAPEIVDARDFVNLVRWFIALAASPARLAFDGSHPGLDKRLDALLKQHRPRLLATASWRSAR